MGRGEFSEGPKDLISSWKEQGQITTGLDKIKADYLKFEKIELNINDYLTSFYLNYNTEEGSQISDFPDSDLPELDPAIKNIFLQSIDAYNESLKEIPSVDDYSVSENSPMDRLYNGIYAGLRILKETPAYNYLKERGKAERAALVGIILTDLNPSLYGPEMAAKVQRIIETDPDKIISILRFYNENAISSWINSVTSDDESSMLSQAYTTLDKIESFATKLKGKNAPTQGISHAQRLLLSGIGTSLTEGMSFMVTVRDLMKGKSLKEVQQVLKDSSRVMTTLSLHSLDQGVELFRVLKGREVDDNSTTFKAYDSRYFEMSPDGKRIMFNRSKFEDVKEDITENPDQVNFRGCFAHYASPNGINLYWNFMVDNVYPLIHGNS